MGRTSKNIKLRIPEKSNEIKGFRNRGYPIADRDFESVPL